jgi:hypothetical protein
MMESPAELWMRLPGNGFVWPAPGERQAVHLAPHQMQERFTSTQDVFVLCHLGVPQLEVNVV